MVPDLIYTPLCQSVNEEDKMTLINAAKDGRIEVVNALMDKGADVDAKESVSRGAQCGLHCRNDYRYAKYSASSESPDASCKIQRLNLLLKDTR